MKFSSQYEKRPPVPNQRATGKKPKNTNLLVVSIALVLALVCVLAAVLVHHFRQKQQEQFKPTITTEAPAPTTDTVPTTQAQASNETTQAEVGDTTVSPYKMDMFSTTVTLNVRSAPDANAAKISMIGQDEPVHVIGHTANGWYQIDLNGTKGYVSDKYLVEAPQLKEHSQSPYYIRVNRTQNMVTVYERNEKGEYQKPVKAFVCSVGLDGKTPTGTFVISERYAWRMLSGNVYGQYATRIDGPYLFHSVPYEKQTKDSLEYEEYNKLGSPASLGCIRLAVDDAKWIHDNCPSGTVVTIYDSEEAEPLQKPTPTRIDVNDKRRGWDPKDPDPANPWN